METHGGALWFESEEGVGTTFHLTLLAAPPPPEPPGPLANAAARPELARVPIRREGIPA